MNCANCGNPVQDDAVFCDQCGTPVEPRSSAETPAQPVAEIRKQEAAAVPAVEDPVSDAVLCPGCGAENTPGEMFCVDCGTPLQAPVPDAGMAASSQAATPPAPAETPSAPVPAETERAAGAVTCHACGTAVAEGDAFCYACGARIGEAAPAEAQATPEAEPPGPVAVQAEPEEKVAPLKEATPPPAPEPRQECPSCGTIVKAGAVFCDFCGAALVGDAMARSASPSQTPSQTAIATTEQAPYLAVADSGIELPLPEGTEVLVGREDPYSSVFPDVDLTPHGGEEKGISRRHFKITLAEGQYAVQDLNSTNYTWVNQQRLQPNVPVRLADGDEIRAGRLKLIFRTRS